MSLAFLMATSTLSVSAVGFAGRVDTKTKSIKTSPTSTKTSVRSSFAPGAPTPLPTMGPALDPAGGGSGGTPDCPIVPGVQNLPPLVNQFRRTLAADAFRWNIWHAGFNSISSVQGGSGGGASSCGPCGGMALDGGSCGEEGSGGAMSSPAIPSCAPISSMFYLKMAVAHQPEHTHKGTYGDGYFAGDLDSVVYKISAGAGGGPGGPGGPGGGGGSAYNFVLNFPGFKREIICTDNDGNGVCENVNRVLKSVTHTATEIVVEFWNGGKITYKLDSSDPNGERNRPSKMTSASGKTWTIARNTSGNMTSITGSNSDSATFTYSGSQLSSLAVTIAGITQSTSFSYNPSGVLSGISQNGNSVFSVSSTNLSGSQTKYTYVTEGGTWSTGYTNDYIHNNSGGVQAQLGQILYCSWNEAGERKAQLAWDSSNTLRKILFIGDDRALYRVGTSSGITVTPITSFTVTGGNYSNWSGISYTLASSSASTSGASSYDDVENNIFTSLTDSKGISTTVGLDSDKFPSSFASAGANNSITRDSYKRVTAINDGSSILAQTYDSNGRALSRTINGITSTNSYDPSGRLSSQTKGSNWSVAYTRNAHGLITKKTYKAASALATAPETTIAYKINGMVDSITTHKAGGNSTVTYDYDSRNRVIKISYGDGTYEEMSYIANTNRIEKSTDRNGVGTKNSYVSGRQTRSSIGEFIDDDLTTAGQTDITDASKYTVTEYSNFISGTNIAQTQRVDGGRTDYEYDHRLRLKKTTRYTSAAKTQSSQVIYGSDNQVLKKISFDGCVTWYGRSVSTGEVLRTIQEFVTPSGLSLSDNASVMAAVRSTADDAKYAISDAYYDTRRRMYKTIDPMGLVTTHDFNSNNQQIRTTVGFGTPLAIQTEWDFDADGSITEMRNPRYFDAADTNGYGKDKTTFTYDDKGRRLTTVSGSGTPLASTVQTVYYYDGRIKQTIDPLGNITETIYDSCCDRSKATKNPLGHGSISNSDPVGRVYHTALVSDVSTHVNLKNPIDAKTYSEQTTKYDALGRTIGQTVWKTARGQVDYDAVPLAGLGGVLSSDGITSQMVYDSNLNDSYGLSSNGGVSITLPSGGSVTLKIGPALTQLAKTESNGGGGISFDSNAPGSATVSVNHDGSVVSFSISDGAGRGVMSGRLKGANDASPSNLLVWNCQSYDHTATVTGYGICKENHRIDKDGNVAKVRIDCGSRIKQQIDVLGNSVARAYHKANNNVVKVTDALGKSTSIAYDDLGRAISQTDQVSVTTSQTYNNAGAVLTQTDGKNNSSTSEYDVLGRRIKLTDRIGGVTVSAYDLASRLTSVEDAEGGITSYGYDDLGQKTSETHPDHVGGSSVGTTGYGIVEFEYDPAGRKFRKTDQLGDTVTFNFNLLGQLTSRDYRKAVNSPSGTIADTDSFTFNSLGQPLTAESERFSNTVSFTYDDFGRQSTESLTIAGQTYTTTVGYDSHSRANKLTFPDNTTVEKTFTTRGMLYKTKYNGTTLDTRSYDNGGRLISSVYNNGVTNNFTYRDDGLVSSIAAVHPGGTATSGQVGTYSYTYDANKNKTSESITGVMSNYGFTTPVSTGYDDADRLKIWNRTDGNQDQSWNLSLVGDWNSFTEEGTTVSRIHNDVRETTKVGSNNLTHDVKGNLTTNINGHAYTWTQDNQLKGVDTDGIVGDEVSFEYDAFNRRVKKNNTIFILNGPRVIAEANSGSSTLTEKYIHGSYVDEQIAKVGTGGTVYYHRNQQYSVTALSNTSGSVIERYTYDSHGNMTIKSPSGSVRSETSYSNHYTYTGRRFDPETNLYYFRARYFDSVLGRFIGRDTLGFVDGTNLYRGYFSPSSVDPSGEFIITLVFGAAVGIGMIYGTKWANDATKEHERIQEILAQPIRETTPEDMEEAKTRFEHADELIWRAGVAKTCGETYLICTGLGRAYRHVGVVGKTCIVGYGVYSVGSIGYEGCTKWDTFTPKEKRRFVVGNGLSFCAAAGGFRMGCRGVNYGPTIFGKPYAPYCSFKGVPQEPSVGPNGSCGGGVPVCRHSVNPNGMQPYGKCLPMDFPTRAGLHCEGHTPNSGCTSWSVNNPWIRWRLSRDGGYIGETIAPKNSIWLQQPGCQIEGQIIIDGPVKCQVSGPFRPAIVPSCMHNTPVYPRSPEK